jgi:alpha-mannosidase
MTLRRDCPYVEFETEIDNTAESHRLRVAFPSDAQADCGYAGQPFDVVARPIQPESANHYGEGDGEPLVGYHPMELFCGIGDGARGFALAAEGVMEYEILPMRNTVCLTLLRATDRLHVGVWGEGSKFKLPAAQLPGPRSFRYAFIPHSGDFEETLPAIEDYLNPLFAVQKDFLEDESMPDYAPPAAILPDAAGFLSVEGDVSFSRLKPAEDGDGAILRLFNPSDEPRRAVVRVDECYNLGSAAMVGLDESGGQPLCICDNAIELTLAKKKIATLRISIAKKGEEV